MILNIMLPLHTAPLLDLEGGREGEEGGREGGKEGGREGEREGRREREREGRREERKVFAKLSSHIICTTTSLTTHTILKWSRATHTTSFKGLQYNCKHIRHHTVWG